MAEQEVGRAALPATRASERAIRRRLAGTGTIVPYLFMAPFLVLFCTFILAPAVLGIGLSLFEYDYLLPGNPPFVALENYVELFAEGSQTGARFWQSVQATATFTVLSVPLLVVVPLAVAVVLDQRFRGQKVFRAIYFMPYALGVAVIGILFRFVLDPNVGLVNFYLGRMGLSDDIPWTTGLPWGWITLAGVTLWWLLGFNAIVYLAGLQEVPRDFYDAATVDGANRWQISRYVTLPRLKNVILFVLTYNIFLQANMFGQSFVITQGAPGDDTTSTIMYIAEWGLRHYQMGDAAAMSYLLALFLIGIAIFNFKFIGRTEA